MYGPVWIRGGLEGSRLGGGSQDAGTKFIHQELASHPGVSHSHTNSQGGALGPVAWKGLTQPMGHFFFTGLPLLRSYAGTLSQHIGSLKETRLVRHPKKS